MKVENTPTRNDAELVELISKIAADQDKQAFARLYRLFAPKLKSYVLRSGSPPEQAEEVVQEAMLAIWRNAARFNPSIASASTWMFTIVRNKRIDLMRKNHVLTVSSDDLWPEIEESEASGPDELVLNDKQSEVLKVLMKKLPKEQQEVLQKVYFEDKSHSVVAEELDLALGTVKSRIRLAVARLGLLSKGGKL